MYQTSSKTVLGDPTTYVGQATVQNCISVALLALIVYEHAITLRREVLFMWQWKFSAVTALFMINRYGALAYGVLAVVSGLVSDHEACKILTRATETAVLMLMLIFGICSALRVYALWNKCIPLFLVVLGLNVGPVALNLYLCSFVRAVNTPVAIAACVAYMPLPGITQLHIIAAARISNIVSDALVLMVILYKTFDTQRNAAMLRMAVPFTTVLIRDGTFYFITVLIMNISQMVIFETHVRWPPTHRRHPYSIKHRVKSTCVITAILVSRFFLDLREAAIGEFNDDEDAVELASLTPLVSAAVTDTPVDAIR